MRQSGLRVTGFQVLRDFEGLSGHLHANKVDVAKAMLEMCSALGSRLLLVCSSTSGHATRRDRRPGQATSRSSRCSRCRSASAWPTRPCPGAGSSTSTRGPGSWCARADRANLGVCLDSFHILAGDSGLGALADIDPRKVFLGAAVGLHVAGGPLAGRAHRHRAALPRLPGEGVHSEQLAELVRRVDETGYRGDYSFEVFNDDYRTLPLPMVAERGAAR